MSIARTRVHGNGEPEEEHHQAKHAQRRLFFDAYALTASTVSNAAAGFASYVISAQLFPGEVVGQAAAMSAAMLLLSGASQLDLANALHRFLPGSGRSAKRLVLGSYAAVAVVSLILGSLFVLIFGANIFGPDRDWEAVWFAGAVAAWSLFNLQDQVLMGMGSSLLVPIENTLHGLARVGLLIAFVGGGAYAVFSTWIIPVLVLLSVISVVIVVRVFPAHVKRCGDTLTMWDFRTVSRFAAGSYIGGLTTLVTINILPILVLDELGAETTGYFYMAWMLTSTVDLVAANFGVSLVVQGATTPQHVPALLRAALRRQITMIGPIIVVLVLFAHPLLSIAFGRPYADASSDMLQLLALGLIARVMWGLYLPAVRLAGQVRAMAVTQVFASVMILGSCCVGLYTLGLKGIGWGYLIAHCTIALVLSTRLIAMFRKPAAAEAEPKQLTAGSLATTSRHKAQRRRRGPIQLLLISLGQDFAIAFHGLFINRIAASILMPRVLRFCIYRLAGMKLQTANIYWGVQFARNVVQLGKGTFVNTNVHFEDVAPIIIGDDCQVGMEVLFVTSHHSTAGGVISKTPDPRPIVVGDRCWIGARAMILPGVTIGDDCVIAAGAVVAKDCAPGGVYAGVPARRIKELNVNG